MQFMDDAEQACEKIQSADYLHIALSLCSRLSSLNFIQHDQQLILLHNYVTSVLLKENEISLRIELKLLLFLPVRRDVSAKNGYAIDRKKEMHLWFRGLHRLLECVDRDFDFKDLPQRNIAPPQQSRSGIAPKHIEDSALRKDYEIALEENKRKAKSYNDQYELKSLEKQFFPRLERQIINMYSFSDCDIGELQELLSFYHINEEIAARIVKVINVEGEP